MSGTPNGATGGNGNRNYAGYDSKGEPDVTYWLNQVRKGLEFRKKAAYETNWVAWRKYYRGEYNDDTLPLNIFFKLIRTMVPRTYFRNPSVSVSSAKPGMEYSLFSQVLERIDNKLIIQMRLKQQMKIAVQNAILFGTGILKLGYGAEFTPTPDPAGTEAPSSKKKIKKKEFSVEYNDLVVPNMPWALSVHPSSFVVPEGAADLNSSRWCCHITNRHVEDVKNDPRMENTEGLQGSKNPGRGNDKAYREEKIPDGHITLYEIWDKKSNKVFIICPFGGGEKKALVFEDAEFLIDNGKFPFFPIVFNEDDVNFWGLPDAKILEPQQRELNENRTQMMKHRRVANVKAFVRKNAMTHDAMEKMSSADPGSVVETEGPPQEDLLLTQFTSIPTGLVQMDQLVEKDVQELIGLGSNQFGEYAPGSADRSATEAAIVNQATQIRMDERRDVVADILVDLVDGFHSIIFNHWDGEQVVDLVGPDGGQVWVSFQAEMLKDGVYDISIDPDSGLPETKQSRQQRAMQVYPILMQNPFIDKVKLTQYLLREMHGVEYDSLMVGPQQLQAMQQPQGQPGAPGPQGTPSQGAAPQGAGTIPLSALAQALQKRGVGPVHRAPMIRR